MKPIKIEKSDFDRVKAEFQEKLLDIYGETWDSWDSGTVTQVANDLAARGTTFKFGETGLFLHEVLNILAKNKA